LAGGSKIQKIESFTLTGITSGLYQDGVRVGDIFERLNLTHDEQDWLSLRPSGDKYTNGMDFGESNEINERGSEEQSFGLVCCGDSRHLDAYNGRL